MRLIDFDPSIRSSCPKLIRYCSGRFVRPSFKTDDTAVHESRSLATDITRENRGGRKTVGPGGLLSGVIIDSSLIIRTRTSCT